jgi:hypothetical protein
MIHQSATAEVPFDEETREIVARRLRLWYLLLPGCLVSTLAVVAALIFFATKVELDRDMVLLVGAAAVALDALAMWLVMRTVTAPFRQDLAGGYYLRARGKLRFTASDGGAVTFDVDGCSLSVSDGAFPRLSEGWNVVDFTERSRIVLAVRDEHGALLYQAGKRSIGAES